MKSPRQPFRPMLVADTAAAREKLADEVYASAIVKTALSTEAGKGLTSAAILTPYAVDLKTTAAASKLVAWLQEQGFRTEWSGRTDPQAGHVYASRFWDLLVSWDQEKTR